MRYIIDKEIYVNEENVTMTNQKKKKQIDVKDISDIIDKEIYVNEENVTMTSN